MKNRLEVESSNGYIYIYIYIRLHKDYTIRPDSLCPQDKDGYTKNLSRVYIEST